MNFTRKGNPVFVITTLITLLFGWLTPSPLEVSAAEESESERVAKEQNLSTTQKAFIDEHIEWAIDLGDKTEEKYGGRPPITSVLAQSALESGWGKKPFCLQHCNDFGIGGVANPKDFESHYASWVYYYNLVATREGYVDNGSLACEYTSDYIRALVRGGYCSDQGYQDIILEIATKIKPYVLAKEAEIHAEREKKRQKLSKKTTEVRETADVSKLHAGVTRELGKFLKQQRTAAL